VSVLAIDLGTSAVKTIVWEPSKGVLARGHATVPTNHPKPGFDEQDADDWWYAVQTALRDLPLDGISGVGLSSQRETFVCLDEAARPLRSAILWSDGRAASPASRWQWVQEHEPQVAERTRWLGAPKDYVLQQLAGRLVTDTTLASRTDVDAALLPEIVEPRTVIGEFRGVPVVAGAGDRACEVLAVGAHNRAPMVSWGTTANCSFPQETADVPAGWRASLHVDGRTLAEAGLSAAGSALVWLSEQVAMSTTDLQALAASAPPGANGVICLPWLNGARAPWWRPDAQMTFLGVNEATTPGDRARAIYEGVAHDLRRSLAQLAEPPRSLKLAGGGSEAPVWRHVLGGITGLPIGSTVGGDAAAIGAAWLGSSGATTGAAGGGVRVGIQKMQIPDRAAVVAYAELSKEHDAAAGAVLGSLA
jgi:xylulokinase